MRRGKIMKWVTLWILVAGVCVFSDEKIVWSPKENIGKTTTWKNNDKASAIAEDGFYEITLKGSEWSGMGLNWEGYWPKDAGQKVADYKNLLLDVKISGANKNDLQIALKDNKSKDSASVFIKKYFEGGTISEERAMLRIPISDLLTEKSEFESGVAWEIMLHCWTQGEKNIKIEIHRIAFE